MQTVVAMLRDMTSRVFRRAVATKHLRVYPAHTGMLNVHVSKFQRDYALKRIPSVFPRITLQAVWCAPFNEPLIPMKYTRSWGGSAMYDARTDCPAGTLRFPTRPIDDAAIADLEMTPVPRGDSTEAATIYDEDVATRQWG